MTVEAEKGIITRERFELAPTFAEYLPTMQANKERMQALFAEIEIPASEIEFWRSRGKLNVYTITFDGCGDALNNIPVMAKIASLCPNIDLRVVKRDDNLDVMADYLKRGQFQSVPVFIFLDESFEEVGNLKERPEKVTEMIERETMLFRRQLYAENVLSWRNMLVEELRDVVAKGKRYP